MKTEDFLQGRSRLSVWLQVHVRCSSELCEILYGSSRREPWGGNKKGTKREYARNKLTLANGCSNIKRPSKLSLLADMGDSEE